MRLSTASEERSARIELLPLMDIMFLVLLFFIYSVFSMSVHRGLKVDLPNANGTLHRGDRTIITVAADDSLYLNKEPMTLDELVPAAVRLWQETATPVLIEADRAASIGTGIELLSKLKSDGIEQVAFQVASKVATDADAKPQPASGADKSQ